MKVFKNPLFGYLLTFVFCSCRQMEKHNASLPDTSKIMIFKSSQAYDSCRSYIQNSKKLSFLVIRDSVNKINVDTVLFDISSSNVSHLYIAKTIFQLNYNQKNSKLKKLSIATNQFDEKLNSFEFLDSLQDLEISSNQYKFPCLILPATLKSLWLIGKFKTLPNFVYKYNVTKLSLTSDSLYYMDDLAKLKSLKWLDIQNTLLAHKLINKDKDAILYFEKLNRKIKQVSITYKGPDYY